MNTQTFAQLVSNQVTAIQGGAKSLLDLAIGSILRVVVEANAAVILWLQGLILQLLAITRAATSNGVDLDSFVADYGMTPRFAASPSSGLVTFARFTATNQALVPVGAIVQTGDGTQPYIVTADSTNGAYSSLLGGYVLASGAASANIPVVAVNAGIGGNVLAGQISVISQAIPYIDTVTNSADYTNGSDAETDAALRLRFIAFIASLSKATKNAIGYAITSLQQNLTYTLVENYTYAGAYQPGYFYAVIDDGTGAPGSTILSSVSNAIDAVRPFTSTFGVFAPTILTATVSMTITTAAGYTHSTVTAIVNTAITNYINSLPMGGALSYSKLAQIAFDASPSVTDVTGVTLNSGTTSLLATQQQVIKSGTVVVS